MSIDWIFGEYKILKKIATGGMAEVFLAKRVGMKGFEKLLAIKRILPQFAENEEFIAMFIDEAKLAAKLNHRNIVQINDFGSQQGSYYIAMEYVFGKDLRSILRKSKERGERLPLAQCAYIITEAAKGLEYAHTLRDHFGNPLQIIHRDISPQNILISYEGEVMLADFGIAKAASKSTETRAGVLKGKILYMSPEQAWGKPIDRRTDLYSLGVVLYEMVTQRKIFDADSEFSMLEKVRNAVVEFPPNVCENIPGNFLKVVQKALDKDPDHRYQSAHDLRVDLENYLLTTQERLSEKAISNYLKHLFREEIEEERKILTEGTEILVEKLTAEEPVRKPTVREPEKISIPKKAPVPFTSKLKFALILILLLLVGGFAGAYFLTRPSSKDIMAVQNGDTSPPPAQSKASPPLAATVVEQPQEKPYVEAKKKPFPEEKPVVPVEKPTPPTRKPLLPAKEVAPPSEKPFPPSAKPAPPEEKPVIPPETPKPVYQAEAEVKPSLPVPFERPKAVEEEGRKAQPAETPPPVARPEKEASLKGPEQRPSPLMGELISQGPQLLTENGQLRILEQVQKLTPEERQNINVKVLECFAHLKRIVVDRDKHSKPSWGQLYQFLEKSNNRNATPLLIKITKDPEEYTRLYAVTLLGSIGDRRAIADLQQIANSDPNRKIRRSAAKSIALIQKRG
jgi:eukaryotic-like serine/threonine-protein kinase